MFRLSDRTTTMSSSSSPSWAFVLVFLLSLLPLVSSERFIESKSLNPCQKHSKFSASLFNVVFTPENRTVHIDVVGVSAIAGNITAEIEVIAYGYRVLRQSFNPCNVDLPGLCPMSTGQFTLSTNFLDIGDDVIKSVPGIAYTIPDLDGLVRVYINSTSSGDQVACVEAELSNAKTVEQDGVSWTTAVIAGLGLVASAMTSSLGHSNTAAHIAANALSLFGYFQAQAMIGMTAVPLPPLVQAWTQNFAWTMGIVRVGFMQRFFNWYQRATGGTPTTLLTTLSDASVDIQKRSLEAMEALFPQRLYERSYGGLDVGVGIDLVRRASTPAGDLPSVAVVRGIERVAFRAGIESSNVFMTGLTFFTFFVLFVILAVAAFRGILEVGVKAGWFAWDKFRDFRTGWRTVLKGIVYRLTLIGYPQICILCLWELTRRDSAAEMVLALFFFLALTGTLGWAAWKVIRLARKSSHMHKNPGYILYSDPAALNKWGFLYVQYRATAYYFVVPVLAYIFLKAAFIGLAQKSFIAQAIALVLIEAAALVGVSILRPWMDKKTNTFNIAIVVINFINVIFLLIFTEVFNQPGIVTGVVGVIFFIVNAIFALVYLILVLVASLYAVFSKNPDTRYQPMRDDRASFTKSQTQLNTELDALGATARGDPNATYKRRDLDDDDTSSMSSASYGNLQPDGAGIGATSSPAHSMGQRPMSQRQAPSHVDPSLPLFPSAGAPRHQAPSNYLNGGAPPSSSELPLIRGGGGGSGTPTPVGQRTPDPAYARTGSPAQDVNAYRQQSNRSPWQRGAGYDH